MRSRVPEVLIGGLLLILAALIFAGQYETFETSGLVSTVNRFTGEVRICDDTECYVPKAH